jgi:hypothetical protein
MALGVAVLWVWAGPRPAPRRFALVATAVAGVLAVAGLATGRFDRRLLASSVYRDGTVPAPGTFESVFHEDGRTATVSAHRRAGTGVLMIATNGKPDASLPDYWMQPCEEGAPRRALDTDAATQVLAPLVTLAHVPDARTGAVIGVGSGMSSHFVLGTSALERVVTIEIEPAMTRGARAFYPYNGRMYDDPRSTIVHDDAKSFFAGSRERFDLIVSEPSNPWVSGVSSLFSTEFYERISGFLTERGVFGQWLHLYEIDDGLVLTVLAAIHRTFRSYAVYQTWNADMVIVATNAAHLPTPAWSVLESPGVTEDLCHVLPFTAPTLDATRLFDRAALAPLLDTFTPANSDYYPVLDLGAERARFLRTSARGVLGLSAARFDFLAPFGGRRVEQTESVIAPIPRIPRMLATAVSAALRNPVRVDALPVGERPANVGRSQFRVARWRAMLDRSDAPDDWIAWLDDFAVVEHAVHGAMRGVADEEFYARARGFVTRTGAPEIVRHAVAFRHGLAAWDFAEAARAGAALLPSVMRRERFVPADLYLDGMVAAQLRVGNAQEARRVFRLVGPLAGRALADLRVLLLDAYIAAAGAPRSTTRNTTED